MWPSTAIIAAEGLVNRPHSLARTSLPNVRRLEAVSFRSWPAASVTYDGTWALRLTAGHPAKRLNSLNPLDPGDGRRLEERLERAERRFSSFGRPLIVRQSPLAPPELVSLLDEMGWEAFDDSRVLTLDLAHHDLTGATDRVPLRDVGRWIDQSVAMESFAAKVKPGLSELIANVEGEVGLFLAETKNGEPLAATMAVRFGDLIGLFEVVSSPAFRREGHGRAMVRSALAWGRGHGATRAWLQVQADNGPACLLYESEGFSEMYRYAYRRAVL